MTTLKEKIKNLSIGAKLGLVGLGLATLVGTFGGNEGGLPPFYNNKSGTWGGINVGFNNQFQENSKFYGISIGTSNLPKQYDNRLPQQYDNRELSKDTYFYGVQFGLANVSENLKGIQWGVVNRSENLNGVQFGLVNKNQKGWFPFINFAKSSNPQELNNYSKEAGK